MGDVCALTVRQWAAISQGCAGEEVSGDIAGEDIIPSGTRRRMGKLERLAVRCMLSLLVKGTTSELIFCSRYGNMETLASLLRSMTAGEPVSPMGFSGSVHNAAPGMVGLIRKERIPHTALAAGSHTLEAGLVEAYARLKADGCGDVIVAYADLPVADVYGELESDCGPGLGLALRLSLGDAGDRSVVQPGRHGALQLLDRLRLGETGFVVGCGPWSGTA